MTEAEFWRLQREIGWTYEYADGYAYIRPRHLVGKLCVPVTLRPVPDTGCRISSLTPDDAPALVPAFADGFHDTVEYCDCSATEVRRAGEEAIATFFAGRRGAFHHSSRLATPLGSPRVVAGAALVVQKPGGPFLDILFVRSRWQRSGLATALMGSVLNALHDLHEARLDSAYNVANQASVAWHTQFGFVEWPEFSLSSARAQAARHELWRREEMGDLTEAGRAALEGEAAHWDRVIEELDAAFSRRAAAGARRQWPPA